MSLRDRLLGRLGVPTEPQHVEKATFREKLKRQVWMIASLLITLTVAWTINQGWFLLFGASWTTIAIGAGTIIAALVVDAVYVFPWGVERFDLVAPWQFRDAEKGGEKS